MNEAVLAIISTSESLPVEGGGVRGKQNLLLAFPKAALEKAVSLSLVSQLLFRTFSNVHIFQELLQIGTVSLRRQSPPGPDCLKAG